MDELRDAIKELIAETMECETEDIKDLKFSFHLEKNFEYGSDDAPSTGRRGPKPGKKRGPKPGVKRGPKPGAKYKKRGDDVLPGAGADDPY